MIMSMRDRNRANGEANFCGACCDSMLHSSKSIKRERRAARRREKQAWRRDLVRGDV